MTKPTPEEDQAAGPQPTRIFVGLKMAPEIAGSLAGLAKKIESVPLRLVPEGDIHLTLVPPWNETSIPAAVEKLGRALAGFDRFHLSFESLRYGPEHRRPRMLWAECAASPEIEILQGALIEAFGQVNERPFRPHVTLARIERNDSTMARPHPVDQRLSLAQSVCSVELFRSPPPGARGYQVVASLPLGESRSDRH
jgi:RNA 2',3'-cyclic 3'-phosphodiesterase